MKKIFTLMLVLGSITAVFAQSSHRGDNAFQSNNNHWNNNYSNNNHQYNGGAYTAPGHGYSGHSDGYNRSDGRNFRGERGYEVRSFNNYGYNDRFYDHKGWFSWRNERHFRERKYHRNEWNW